MKNDPKAVLHSEAFQTQITEFSESIRRATGANLAIIVIEIDGLEDDKGDTYAQCGLTFAHKAEQAGGSLRKQILPDVAMALTKAHQNLIGTMTDDKLEVVVREKATGKIIAAPKTVDRTVVEAKRS